MIQIIVDKKKELTTFSTLLKINERYVRLFFSRLTAYLKEGDDDFDDYFLFTKDAFTNSERSHQIHNWIVSTNYTRLGAWHELQWEEVKVEDKGHYLVVANEKKNHLIAIPPNGFPEPRYDYITVDGKYHYDCKQNEFEGIEIFRKAKFKYPFIPKDIKFTEGKAGAKKERAEEHYTEFIEGETYFTKFQTRERFTLYKIDRLAGNITKFWGVYENSEHLGLCPIAPERLLKP